MTYKKFRLTWAIFTALSFAAWGPCSQQAPAKKLTLLHFNDVYELEPLNGGKTGGAARVKTLIDSYEKENPLILFSGDAFGGSTISMAEKGKPMVEAFNALGLDYAVFGNHEFDYGLANVKEQVQNSRFVWIISNMLEKQTGQPPAGALPYVVTEWNGVKIGIIGLIDNWLDETLDGSKLQYLDYLTQGRRYARLVRAEGAQFVIALTHMYLRHDADLARNVPEIDLVLGGHDHEPLSRAENGTLIWKSGSDWENVGLIRASVPECGEASLKAEALPVTPALASDKKLSQLVESYAAKRDALSHEQVGESEVELDVREKTVRQGEALMGNLVTDAMRDATRAQAALTNGGGIRSNQVYPPGPVTRRMIDSILPFPNKVVSLKVTGEQLKRALENGVSNYEHAGGRFPQVSGIRFSFDPARASGDRVVAIEINGKGVDPEASYTVATLDFLAGGGDGYAMFKDLPRVIGEAAASPYAQIVADYVKKKGIVAPQLEGRIRKIAGK